MQHVVEHGPAFAWLRVGLAPGETIQAEAGAMVRRDVGIEMDTHLNAGHRAGFFRKIMAFFVALVRKMLGGETLFVNDFTAPGSTSGGEVVLAPALSGQIVHHKMDGSKKLVVQAGSYLASTGTVDTKLRWGGLRMLLSREGLFLLECTGEGDLFITSYGDIIPVQIDGEYIVDTGHMVAYEGNLTFKVGSAGGGFKGLFLSGEGLVMTFQGTGTVYLQSRNLGGLVSWLTPMLQ
ncbi:MAG: TIGR00266 family protein [Myxococcales bacterium]|nr:TIGR00266 family protein [Myxococcales bacterium]